MNVITDSLKKHYQGFESTKDVDFFDKLVSKINKGNKLLNLLIIPKKFTDKLEKNIQEYLNTNKKRVSPREKCSKKI